MPQHRYTVLLAWTMRVAIAKKRALPCICKEFGFFEVRV
jgi:hypothetical protein